MRNTDPTAPWNSAVYKDDPCAPHNHPAYRDDPSMPWNSIAGSANDLKDDHKDYYR